MEVYDQHYQTENLFGSPSAELIAFFEDVDRSKTVLDLGCGQGRDAIALSRMGFEVTGVDTSRVGIEQMAAIALRESLPLKGVVADIYSFKDIPLFDIILLDSMFHFDKKNRRKEEDFIKRLMDRAKPGAMVVFCIQDSGSKVSILEEVLRLKPNLNRLADLSYDYLYQDPESDHTSKTPYRLIAVQKPVSV